jgi:hypothetical protein
MKSIPQFSVDLIEQLNEYIPAKPPGIEDSDRKVWWDAGQRALVQLLLDMTVKARKKGVREPDMGLAINQDEEDS